MIRVAVKQPNSRHRRQTHREYKGADDGPGCRRALNRNAIPKTENRADMDESQPMEQSESTEQSSNKAGRKMNRFFHLDCPLYELDVRSANALMSFTSAWPPRYAASKKSTSMATPNRFA